MTIGADTQIIIGGLSSIITLFGWYMAYIIRRPVVFRFKLGITFIIPACLAVSYLCPVFNISRDYQMMLTYVFILLLHILYWRELKTMGTSIGYHKSVLANFLDNIPDCVWMKDLDGRFTYTNKALHDKILHSTPEKVFGKTGEEVTAMRGDSFTFGAICCDTNTTTMRECHCRFMECGEVDGKFIALHVYKTPIVATMPDGSKRIVGSICMGRDLTYDWEDHELIKSLCNQKRIPEALQALDVHIQRYCNNNDCCSAGLIGN